MAEMFPRIQDNWSLGVSWDTELIPVHFVHARSLYALVEADRAVLGRWLPWVARVQSVDDYSRLIGYYRAKNSETGAFTCAVRYQSALAGVLSINEIDPEEQSASLGYWLGRPFRGLGLMRDSCRSLVDFLFTCRNIDTVMIRCAVDNLKSQKIPEALGFRKEMMLTREEWINDCWVDLWSYSLSHQEWPVSRADYVRSDKPAR